MSVGRPHRKLPAHYNPMPRFGLRVARFDLSAFLSAIDWGASNPINPEPSYRPDYLSTEYRDHHFSFVGGGGVPQLDCSEIIAWLKAAQHTRFLP